ncbi:MAG: MaoC family dehydratase [Thermoanaerobaculia bacterium]|nr:MaoC family dehydratase [Thermoanaerobaculia bacterium]
MSDLARLTGSGNYFEDFEVGDRLRHVRGKTVGEFENQILTHLVMNTAHSHFNEDAMQSSPWGQRLVFGLVTGSIVVGLATQDVAENALAELGLDELRFTAPVFHGDTLWAYSEVVAKEPSEREDAGVVVFRHHGYKQDDTKVFEGLRRVLLKRRSPWEAR